LKGHEQDVYSLDYSRDGKILASGSGDHTAKIWEVETGKCLHNLAEPDAAIKDAGVTSVAISPDGRLLASVSRDFLTACLGIFGLCYKDLGYLGRKACDEIRRTCSLCTFCLFFS
jgi:hypothetical protein